MSEFSSNPLLQFLYWFLNTPGIGALFVAFLGSSLLLVFFMVLRWISNAAKIRERDVFHYPTEGFHHLEK